MITVKRGINIFSENDEIATDFYRDGQLFATRDNEGLRFVDYAHDFKKQHKKGIHIAKINDRNYYRLPLNTEVHEVQETKRLSDGSRIIVTYRWIDY